MDAALEDFIADQRELRRDFDADGGEASIWSERVEELGAPERREARRRTRWRGCTTTLRCSPSATSGTSTRRRSCGGRSRRRRPRWRRASTARCCSGSAASTAARAKSGSPSAAARSAAPRASTRTPTAPLTWLAGGVEALAAFDRMVLRAYAQMRRDDDFKKNWRDPR